MSFDENTLYNIKTSLPGTRCPLFDLAIWKNGLAFKKIDFSEDGVPVIKIAELNNGIGSNTSFTEGDYGEEVRLHQGDLLFSWSGNPQTSIDVYKYQLDDGWLNQHIFKVTANETMASKDFLFYLLKYLKPHFTQIATNKQTTGLGHVTIADLKRMSVVVPEKIIQDRIVAVVKTIDDKIEVNNEINKNLLEQAENIFNKYYDVAINQQPFTSIISVLGGGTPKTSNSDFWNGEIPFFTPKDVGSPYTFQTEKYITVDGLGHCNSRLYPINTSFVTARGTVGKVSLAGVPMAMNQSCYALASDTIDPILVYFYTLRAVDSLKHKASGAVFDAIVTRDFNTELINVLPETDSNTVLELVSPMLEIVHNNSAENLRLAVLRDALLPQLMSGELDVSDIDL